MREGKENGHNRNVSSLAPPTAECFGFGGDGADSRVKVRRRGGCTRRDLRMGSDRCALMRWRCSLEVVLINDVERPVTCALSVSRLSVSLLETELSR